jgi:hypothetical protein
MERLGPVMLIISPSIIYAEIMDMGMGSLRIPGRTTAAINF